MCLCLIQKILFCCLVKSFEVAGVLKTKRMTWQTSHLITKKKKYLETKTEIQN